MHDLILSLPPKKAVEWSTEVRPKQAQAWLAGLPLANSTETARLLYRAVYALNRAELGAQTRFELMELYSASVLAVTTALQAHLSKLDFPLSQKKRQLADFLCQAHMEMAYGYKLIVHDFVYRRYRPRPELVSAVIGRAIYYLGQVLLRTYQIYMPSPSGVWREIHALYRYAEGENFLAEPVSFFDPNRNKTTITKTYQQVLLLGLCGPYQLAQNECHKVYTFLDLWAQKAVITAKFDVINPVGHFLIDLAADSPPASFPRDVKLESNDQLRVLNAIGLASTVHAFMNRLHKGESLRALELGRDCVGSVCLDMLRHMVRFWGLSAKRQFSRVKKDGDLPICVGINAVHFFSSGQRSFVAPGEEEEAGGALPEIAPIESDVTPEQSNDESAQDFIDLDEVQAEMPMPLRTGESLLRAREMFRVDPWQIRDESAGGLSLARTGEARSFVHVGDLLGIEDELSGRWRIGVARWLKTPEARALEMGVEMLAPNADPVTVKPAAAIPPASASHKPDSVRSSQALLLPAIIGLRRPDSLLVARGVYQPGHNLWLTKEGAAAQLISPIKLLERTGAFEHILFTVVTKAP